MLVEKNVAITLRDAAVLKANVYRPAAEGRYPVLMTHGPYGKDVHFADGYAAAWQHLRQLHPGIDRDGSSGRYLRWETPDPERWVPHGYVVVAVDSRGTGQSPGLLQVFSPQETRDYHDCIEWAGVQPWSNGRVGLLGISYYAVNQWQVAATQPRHLAAIVPWEGMNDFYREMTHHGGILSRHFLAHWWPNQVLVNQHGNGATTHRDRETGQPTTGPALPADFLRANRIDYPEEIAAHAFDDDWHAQRTPDLAKVQVPLLSAGNWGGLALHLRGNVEGFLRAGSRRKWLELHGGTHYESFYMPRWLELQRAFLDHFLKGEDNGWDRRPPVLLHVRRVDGFTEREEHEWPLARTRWTRLHLHAQGLQLLGSPAAQEGVVSWDTAGKGVEWLTPPFDEETEFTGPASARLWVETSTADADFFLTLRLLDPAGQEVTFRGASEAAVPLSQGWLRLSHRELDPARSTPWRPWHPHARAAPVQPDTCYPVDVELWPTSIVVPRGHRLALLVEGRDFSRSPTREPRTGSGPFVHADLHDRPADRFAGINRIRTGGARDSSLLLPLIPARA